MILFKAASMIQRKELKENLTSSNIKEDNMT